MKRLSYLGVQVCQENYLFSGSAKNSIHGLLNRGKWPWGQHAWCRPGQVGGTSSLCTVPLDNGTSGSRDGAGPGFGALL